MSTDIQTINNTVTPAEIVMPGNAASIPPVAGEVQRASSQYCLP